MSTSVEGRASFHDGPTNASMLPDLEAGEALMDLGALPAWPAGYRLATGQDGTVRVIRRAPGASTGDAATSDRAAEAARIADIQRRNKAFWERRNGG